MNNNNLESSSPYPVLRPSDTELFMLPLGGVGEIGMNMTLYGHDGRWLLVDCGVIFPDDHAPGVELIMPDPSFLLDNIDNLVGVIITHPHEDHLGALPFLADVLNVPLFTSPFAHDLIQTKLIERNINPSWQAHTFKNNVSFELSPFTITPIPITHSTVEAYSFLIDTPAGNVLHSGDWKIDHSPIIGEPFNVDNFKKIGNNGLLACVCDSTNIFENEFSKSEQEIRESLSKVVAEINQGRIAITCFASNITRVESAIIAGDKAGRKVCVAGRSMFKMIELAQNNGYLKNIPEIISPKEARILSPEKILFVVAGCQGERRGTTTRISQDQHKEISLQNGDTVIFSSREIPGNEKAISQVYNNFAEKNVTCIKSNDYISIHGSGHASRPELEYMHSILKPKILIPVHGENAQLYAHKEVAKNVSQISHVEIAKNGECIALSNLGVKFINTVQAGKWFIEENRILDSETSGHRKRKSLSFKGTAFLSFAIDKKGYLVSEPLVSCHGIGDDFEISKSLSEWCDEYLEEILIEAISNDNNPEKKTLTPFKRELFRQTGKKPIVFIHCLIS